MVHPAKRRDRWNVMQSARYAASWRAPSTNVEFRRLWKRKPIA
jgi:hypothetical protein